MEVVVCDDDPGVRQVIGGIAADLGFTVRGETDEPTEAVELVDRFGAGLLVLDLSLPHGDGLEALRMLRAKGSTCRVVVFSAYAFDPDRLRGAGADAVVDKLRFDELEEVLLRLGRVERRRDPGRRPLPEPAPTVSPRGLEPPREFEQALAEVRPGDVVMVFALDDHDGVVGRWGELGASDLLAELAGHVRHGSRVGDHLAGSGQRRLALALPGALATGAAAVFGRVRRRWETSGSERHGWAARPSFSAAFAVVLDGELASEALGRTERALDRGLPAGASQLWQAEP